MYKYTAKEWSGEKRQSANILGVSLLDGVWRLTLTHLKAAFEWNLGKE
jgi:hypothetical protein